MFRVSVKYYQTPQTGFLLTSSLKSSVRFTPIWQKGKVWTIQYFLFFTNIRGKVRSKTLSPRFNNSKSLKSECWWTIPFLPGTWTQIWQQQRLLFSTLRKCLRSRMGLWTQLTWEHQIALKCNMCCTYN